MPVTAILDLQLKADALDRANDVMRETLTATRAFPGCLGVTVLVDQGDPTHVAVYEQWESPEADAAYRKWRATAGGRLGPRHGAGGGADADPVHDRRGRVSAAG